MYFDKFWSLFPVSSLVKIRSEVLELSQTDTHTHTHTQTTVPEEIGVFLQLFVENALEKEEMKC
jgi:hypothetical protein